MTNIPFDAESYIIIKNKQIGIEIGKMSRL